MKKGKIRLVGAPPGSGKSTVKAALEEELGSTWLVLEHEQVFTPEMRVETAKLAGIELSSKEFVLGANLPGQMAFQALLRSVADTGLNVVGMGPFENVYGEVAGVPLWRKMKTLDFGLYDLELVYFLVSLSERDEWILEEGVPVVRGQGEMASYWEPIEKEIQRRLNSVPSRDRVPLAAAGDRSPTGPKLEIKRRWLVDEVPRGVMATSHIMIAQGYLHLGRADREMLIRRESDLGKVNSYSYSLSRTSGVGIARSEVTIDISESQFVTLWPATVGARVETIRVRIPHGGRMIELDLFCGALKGLCVAEVEFSSSRAAQSFTAPGWFGREVTDDSSYTRRALASPERGIKQPVTEKLAS
jgi:adenylate cyclase